MNENVSPSRRLELFQTFESVPGTPDEVVCGALSRLIHVTIVPTTTVTSLCLKFSSSTVTAGVGVGEGVAVGGRGVGLGGTGVAVGGTAVEVACTGVDVGDWVAVGGAGVDVALAAVVAEGPAATGVGGVAVKVGVGGTDVGLTAVCVAVGGTMLVAVSLTVVAVADGGSGVEVEGTGDDVGGGVTVGWASATCAGVAEGVDVGSGPASPPQAIDRPISDAAIEMAISHRYLNLPALPVFEGATCSRGSTYAGGSGVSQHRRQLAGC